LPNPSPVADSSEATGHFFLQGGFVDADGDQGTSDNFYHQGQLLPENFQKAAAEKGDGGVRIRFQEGYDHSYFTMATFADDHVGHAARYLLG